MLRTKFFFQLLQGAGDCIYAFAVGLIIYLVVEMPSRKVVNLFFSKRIESKECVLKENTTDDRREKVKLK